MQPLFTLSDGSLLIRLFLAHLLADFVFQTSWMVNNKRLFSKAMGLHIFLVFLFAVLLTGLWWMAVGIAVIHYLIDLLKIYWRQKNIAFAASGQNKTTFIRSELFAFLADQGLHVLALVLFWIWSLGKVNLLWLNTVNLMLNYEIGLIILAYAWVIWPLGFILKFATQNLYKKPSPEYNTEEEIAEGGRLIGVFERIIILTFVLFQQYGAIGFLITGKSILRLGSKQQTEYVLTGTLMSYALAILTGVIVNWLLSIAWQG